jgi:hypothetical protein
MELLTRAVLVGDSRTRCAAAIALDRHVDELADR